MLGGLLQKLQRRRSYEREACAVATVVMMSDGNEHISRSRVTRVLKLNGVGT